MRASITLREVVVCVVVLLMATHASMLPAAETYWHPRVQAGIGHNDNIRLVDDDFGQPIDSSALYQAQVEGELGASTDDETTALFARYWYQSVKERHVLDSDIAQVRWNYAKTMERGSLSVDLSAQHDTTLTSEFELMGSGVSPDEKKDRHYYSGFVDYTWNFSPINYVNTSVRRDSVRYLDVEDTTLSSYDTTSYAASFGHVLDERARLGVQMTYSVFDIPDVNGKYVPVGPTYIPLDMSYETHNKELVGFAEYAISERENIALQCGVRSSNFYQDSDWFNSKEDGNGRVMKASYKRNHQTGSLQLSLSRDLQPNGAGTVVEQDSAVFAFNMGFTDRLSFNVGVAASKQRQPLSNQLVSGDRTYFDTQVGLSYATTEEQTIALELAERRQRYDTEARYAAESTGVFLRWYWNPPQRELSW